jgi:hypothetical protein
LQQAKLVSADEVELPLDGEWSGDHSTILSPRPIKMPPRANYPLVLEVHKNQAVT